MDGNSLHRAKTIGPASAENDGFQGRRSARRATLGSTDGASIRPRAPSPMGGSHFSFLFLDLTGMAAQANACSRATLTASKPEHRLTLQVNKIKDPETFVLFNPGLRPNTQMSPYQAISTRPLRRQSTVAKCGQ